MKSCVFQIGIILIFSIHFVCGQPGSLDPTFGNNGIAITDFNISADKLSALEIQPDQKILAVGWAYGLGRFLTCRFNIDGTLDTNFGDNGLFTVLPPEIVACEAAALQSDGKIILTGTKPIFIIETKSDEEDLILMRLNQDGKIDSTFGVDGIVITDLGGYFERIEEVLIQSDGKILVAGEGSDNIQGGFFYMIRYEANGQLDPTFGNQGIRKIYEVFEVQTMVLQLDDKLLIGGFTDLGPSGDFEVLRFESDGSWDSSFGDGGKVKTDLSGQSDYVDGIIVEPDGRIFVSGGANYTSGSTDLAFARYNYNGSMDVSYGNNGFEVIPLPTTSRLFDVARQSDGKYVLCGASNHLDGEVHVLLIRINHNGGLDETFGEQGIVYTLTPESYYGAGELVIQDNNYIVLGGVSTEPGSDSDFTLSRYIVDDVVATKDQNMKSLLMAASPNPCKEFFTVELGMPFEEFHCNIYDLTGRLMLDRTVSSDSGGRVKISTESIYSSYFSVLLENKVMRGVVSVIVQK